MGCEYARRVLGVEVRDLTGGFKCFRASALEAIDYASVRSQGYAFQVELTYRALRRGLRVEEVPIVFREREHGHIEDVVGDRGGGGVARAGAAFRAPAVGGFGGTGSPADHIGVKAEELALVQGWADTRRTLVDWRRAPARVLVPWTLGALAVAGVLLLAVLVVASISEPDPSGAASPASRTRPSGRRLRVRPLPQRPRARAARARLRRRLHGRLGAADGGDRLHRRRGARSTIAPARWRSAS